MSTKIGSQHGITAMHNVWRDAWPDKTLLVKKDGKWPDMWTALAGVPIDQWKAIDKHQRSEQLLVDDHDAATTNNPGPPVPDDDYLEDARGRIFLAQSPLDALDAPDWMVPVCTADLGYRHWYTTDVIDQLRARFGIVEAWCDCREPPYGTPYREACEMVDELGLDGPAWGQCETPDEFDHAYTAGCRRMVGNLSALRPDQIDLITDAEVLVTAELYRNLQPSMQPDWKGANDGIGGNCIACYGSSTEGAIYTPVSAYRDAGLYVAGNDSVYGVGLTPEDWRDLG